MDTVSTVKRSWIMRQVKGRNTVPEQAVRSLLHRMGFRFRLHDKAMPGKPDIVLPKWHTVVFVHGCFWHRHPDCKRATMPATNINLWREKFERTVVRDAQNELTLESLGWHVLVIWECELKNLAALHTRLSDYFSVLRVENRIL